MAERPTEAWRTYPYRSGELTFPDDEGVRPGDPFGWWYVILHLDDEDGSRTILLTSFVTSTHEQLGSVTDLSRCRHLHQYLTGTVTAEAGHLDVRFRKGGGPVNYLRQVADAPFCYDFRYRIEGYEFKLRLEAEKPPYALADTGRVEQLPGVYTYYYVQPRLAVRGTMRRDDGTSTKVRGMGWLDRQWYLEYPDMSAYVGHFWMAVHLSDGTDMAAYRCLMEGGSSPYPLFDVMGPDNSYRHFAADCIKPGRLFQTTPVGELPIQEFRFPLSAKVVHPPTGTDLTLAIIAKDPMKCVIDLGPKGCLFEAGFTVAGFHKGKVVSGDAFVEVTLLGAELGAEG